MCGSSQVHPERYVPVHAGKKLGCRDSFFFNNCSKLFNKLYIITDMWYCCRTNYILY